MVAVSAKKVEFYLVLQINLRKSLATMHVPPSLWPVCLTSYSEFNVKGMDSFFKAPGTSCPAAGCGCHSGSPPLYLLRNQKVEFIFQFSVKCLQVTSHVPQTDDSPLSFGLHLWGFCTDLRCPGCLGTKALFYEPGSVRLREEESSNLSSWKCSADHVGPPWSISFSANIKLFF